MQTLTIPIPEGFEIDSLDKTTGVITLREKMKDVFERINTVEDAIKELGESDDDVIILKKLQDVLPNDSHPVAHQKVVVLTKAFNEGWLPDWNNSNQEKYYPWFDMGGSYWFRFNDFDIWRSRSVVGSRLCFILSEVANHVGKQFIKLYKDYFVL
jgi:hypothetical protein